MSNPFNPGELSDFDLLEQRPFEQSDYDILKSYEAVVDGLAMLIGSHCEIVLHSLEILSVRQCVSLMVNTLDVKSVRLLPI